MVSEVTQSKACEHAGNPTLARRLGCFLQLALFVVACILPLAVLTLAFLLEDEPLYAASRQTEKRLLVGERPTVVVQLKTLGTHIKVTKGKQGEVIVSLDIGTVSKISRDVAEDSVRRSPGARLERDGDRIQVIESPLNLAVLSVSLVVPPDCSLELQGPNAEICVGCEPTGHLGAPIPVVRLKAATEGILYARVESSSSGPPILDLEGSRIELTIDGSLVPVNNPVKNGEFGAIHGYKRP